MGHSKQKPLFTTTITEQRLAATKVNNSTVKLTNTMKCKAIKVALVTYLRSLLKVMVTHCSAQTKVKAIIVPRSLSLI